MAFPPSSSSPALPQNHSVFSATTVPRCLCLWIVCATALLVLPVAGSPSSLASAYVVPPHAARGGPSPASRNTVVVLRSSNNNNNNNIHKHGNEEEKEDVFTPTTRDAGSGAATGDPPPANLDDLTPPPANLDDLTPPGVNLARNSILFSENPSTRARNNPPLETWKFARANLPPLLTGAWPWRDLPNLDERPVEALYNTVVVRFPVLLVAATYLYQKIAEGHDLVIDLGFDASGPQAVPPVLVISVLVLILL